MIKDAYWFAHDSNASQDPKMIQLLSVWDFKGYGWYWRIVESLREQTDYKLALAGRFALPALATMLHTDAPTLNQFLEDCIEIGLFKSDGTFLWTNSLMERMRVMDEKRQANRRAARARWGTNEEPPKQLPPAEEEAPPTKGPRFTPPTLDELYAFFAEKGSSKVEAEKFYAYYESNGWHVGKNKMKLWRSAATGWILRSKENRNGNKPNRGNAGASSKSVYPTD